MSQLSLLLAICNHFFIAYKITEGVQEGLTYLHFSGIVLSRKAKSGLWPEIMVEFPDLGFSGLKFQDEIRIVDEPGFLD